MTAAGEVTVSVWNPSPFNNSRNASRTSVWSSAIKALGLERLEIIVVEIVIFPFLKEVSGARCQGVESAAQAIGF